MNLSDPLGVYSDADVLDALRSRRGSRTISFRFDRLNESNVYVEPIDRVIGGGIDHNYLAQIERTAKFQIADGTSINFLKDRIKPWCRLRMSDGGIVEWPLGVFLLSTPGRRLISGAYVTREVEAYDQLLILRDDRVSTRYTVAAGVVYTTAISTLLAGYTFAKSIVTTALTTPVAMEWEPGTTYLQILNDLLSAVNYDTAFFDENGTLVVQPYLSPASRASEITYGTDEHSVIRGDIDHTLDLFDVPNKWTLVVSDPDRPALSSSYTNTATTSPTSTVSRGRTIVDFRTEQDAADQTTLDAKVARLAFEASQVYEYVEFETGIMPVHSHADVYSLDIDGLAVAAKFSEHTWGFPFKAGAAMKHKVRRVVTV